MLNKNVKPMMKKLDLEYLIPELESELKKRQKEGTVNSVMSKEASNELKNKAIQNSHVTNYKNDDDIGER